MIWGPKVCLFQRRKNRRKIHNKHYDIYERAVTFDGPDLYSENVALRGKAITKNLRQLCKQIEDHVFQLSGLSSIYIKRMFLYFKQGKNSKLHFLWCSSLRIDVLEKGHRQSNIKCITDLQCHDFVNVNNLKEERYNYEPLSYGRKFSVNSFLIQKFIFSKIPKDY